MDRAGSSVIDAHKRKNLIHLQSILLFKDSGDAAPQRFLWSGFSFDHPPQVVYIRHLNDQSLSTPGIWVDAHLWGVRTERRENRSWDKQGLRTEISSDHRLYGFRIQPSPMESEQRSRFPSRIWRNQ